MQKYSRRSVRIKHVNVSGTWPSGNPRAYFRPKGEKGTPLPDAPPESAFYLARYAELLEGHSGASPSPRNDHYSEGSVGQIIALFTASEKFKSLAPLTQQQHRRPLEAFRHKYGSVVFKDIRDNHIKRDLRDHRPHPANFRLKVWRALFKWAFGADYADRNYALMVPKRDTPKAVGAIPWSKEEVQQFRDFWGLETPHRLAFEVVHRTAADAVDVVKIGPQHVGKDGYIAFRRQKSGEIAVIPFYSAPAWSEPTDDLERSYAAQEAQHLTYVVTQFGKPRSHKAFCSWFSDAATAAGLENRTAKGLRKHRFATFKENGASMDQRLAWLGQDSEDVDSVYSKTADKKKVIQSSNFGSTSSNSRK